MKKFFFLFLMLSLPLQAAVMIQSQRINLASSQKRWITPLNLEHATTAKELQWGLMQRPSMQKNSGMTFTFPASSRQKIWMFNCLIDLSVAFLDNSHVIREIYHLKAHPEMMDPKRPVTNLNEMSRYSANDPIVQFFSKESITSKMATRLALEVPAGWFEENEIHPGDVVVWHKESNAGFVMHTLNLDAFTPLEDAPIMVEFSGKLPHAVWRPMSQDAVDIAFLNASMEVLNDTTLVAGASVPLKDKNVVISAGIAKSCLIAPKGWLKRHLLHGGVTVDSSLLPDISVER